MSVPGVVRLSLLLSVVGAPLATAAPEPDPAGPLDPLLETLPHAMFEWSAVEGVSDRAAMRVPVDLDGTKGWLQLDTGLDVTLVYGSLARDRGWEEVDGRYRIPDVALGPVPLGPLWVFPREEHGGGDDRLGSLGLDVLAGHLVVIDYPGRRFALREPGAAPAWLLRRTTWTPAELRDAKLFLTVTLGGSTVSGLVFDTGSSAFDVIVDFDEWQTITGCTGSGDASVVRKVSSWGSRVTAVGCPGREPLVIGSVRIPEAVVYYLEEQPRLFEGWPFPATGLVGNAPFLDRVVVLDLGLRPRFGIVE